VPCVDFQIASEKGNPPHSVHMNFEIDNQTKKDLELFRDDRKIHSIFSFFNKTHNSGGKDKLYDMMSTPTSDAGGFHSAAFCSLFNKTNVF
jgi:hypothetical protein